MEWGHLGTETLLPKRGRAAGRRACKVQAASTPVSAAPGGAGKVSSKEQSLRTDMKARENKYRYKSKKNKRERKRGRSAGNCLAKKDVQTLRSCDCCLFQETRSLCLFNDSKQNVFKNP